MRFSLISFTILLAGAVSAEFTREIDGEDQSHLLVKRLETCRGSSCAACFGAGSIVCEGNSCFNPTAGEQCCKGGKYCIGKDSSCCSAGPGITGGVLGGGSGATSTRAGTTSLRAATATNLALPSSSTWSCKSFDSDEECCQRGGSDSHWCSGGSSGLRIHCYRPARGDICCSNGKSCLGDGCCAQLGASSISPVPTSAKTGTTKRLTATTDDDEATGTATGSRFSLSVASASGSRATATSTSIGAGPDGALSASGASSEVLVKGFAVIIVGAVGIIAML